MAEEPKTEMEKTLRALLLVSLESMKQKGANRDFGQGGIWSIRYCRSYWIHAEGRQRSTGGNQKGSAQESEKVRSQTFMAKNAEATVLSTLQDLLIFQMASKGVPQGQIREAVGLDRTV